MLPFSLQYTICTYTQHSVSVAVVSRAYIRDITLTILNSVGRIYKYVTDGFSRDSHSLYAVGTYTYKFLTMLLFSTEWRARLIDCASIERERERERESQWKTVWYKFQMRYYWKCIFMFHEFHESSVGPLAYELREFLEWSKKLNFLRYMFFEFQNGMRYFCLKFGICRELH